LDLASRGAEIMACDVRLDALGGLRELARGKALKLETCQADVTEEKDVEKLFQVFMERFGRLDAVINNAGVAEDGLLVKYKGDLLEKFPCHGGGGAWRSILPVSSFAAEKQPIT
jgi:NAD(P)-dependent dehydrogenase (short-subunit alcohol dehydrogenase family)